MAEEFEADGIWNMGDVKEVGLGDMRDLQLEENGL